jgi:hypothetical protein
MRIYVSYRRTDSAAISGRVSDRLASHFGTQNVSMDVDSIPLGSDLRQAIEAEIRQCDVLVALIGPKWLGGARRTDRRRIDNPIDVVRIEIETALKLIPVVPVLVEGAEMPRSVDLPPSLQELSARNAVVLDSGRDFHLHTDRLIRGLENLVAAVSATPQDRSHENPDIESVGSGPSTVFVSHATRDRKWVEKHIVRLLETNDIKPWYSTESIKTGAQWEREIKRGMESCDWFVLVVSPRAEESEWIKDELNWAIYNRPTRIVPVILEYCNLWNFHIRLPRIQHIDFTRDISIAEQKLVQMFKNDAQT